MTGKGKIGIVLIGRENECLSQAEFSDPETGMSSAAQCETARRRRHNGSLSLYRVHASCQKLCAEFLTQPILAKVANVLANSSKFLCRDDFPPNASSNLRKVEQLLSKSTRGILRAEQ